MRHARDSNDLLEIACDELWPVVRDDTRLCFGVLLLGSFENYLDVGLPHRLSQVPMHDRTTVPIQNAAQVIEGPPGPGGGLYGTTYSGGSPGCSGDTCGTVYRVTPQARVCEKAFCSGTETVLYRFTGGRDGANPTWGDLNFDPSGNVYGTALQGGDNGVGAVFMLSPSHGGWTESTLYSFALETGAYPQSGMIFDSAGNLYDAASNYGLYGYGMIYQLAPSASGWTETTLYSFQGTTDGLGPVGGLIFDRAGNVYGTTVAAGAGTGGGTVYKLADSLF